MTSSGSKRSASITAKRLADAFGRTLVLLPHHDDECAAGALLQYLGTNATVLFLTDSAPLDDFFWGKHGSRERYRALRQQESLATLDSAGVTVEFATIEACDQELHLHLEEAAASLEQAIAKWKPRTLLAPAYEGGHPDHDCASFLAAMLTRERSLQHWELPYYHLTRSGKYRRQQFLAHPSAPVEWELLLSPEEVAQKRSMWSQYESQCDVLREFEVERETYRRAPAYDYARAPHGGTLNYESWGWKVMGRDLVEAFAKLRQIREEPAQPRSLSARMTA